MDVRARPGCSRSELQAGPRPAKLPSRTPAGQKPTENNQRKNNQRQVSTKMLILPADFPLIIPLNNLLILLLDIKKRRHPYHEGMAPLLTLLMHLQLQLHLLLRPLQVLVRLLHQKQMRQRLQLLQLLKLEFQLHKLVYQLLKLLHLRLVLLRLKLLKLRQKRH